MIYMKYTKKKTIFLNVNYISGNIIVVIDGIEEIESYMEENLDLQKFLTSLKKLDESFLKTKVIITTREHFLDKIKKIDSENNLNIQYFRLQGFTKDNLEKFLSEKYKSFPKNINKAKEFIKKQ